MKKSTLLTVLILAIALSMTSCDDDSSRTPGSDITDATGDVMPDADGSCARGEVPLTVTGHTVEGRTLTLDVAFPDTCATHEFGVWWSGAVGTSDPPVLPLEFHHYVTGETCQGEGSATVVIDLTALHDQAREPTNALRLQLLPAWPSQGEFVPEILYEVAPEAPAAPTDAVPITLDCGGITG